MPDLAQHAVEHGALLLLGDAADLAEAERTERAAVPLALADLASDLGDAHLRHRPSRPSSSARGAAWASPPSSPRRRRLQALPRRAAPRPARRPAGPQARRQARAPPRPSASRRASAWPSASPRPACPPPTGACSRPDGGARRGGVLQLLQPLERRQRQHLADLLPADARDVLGAAQLLERDDGGLRHVDRVRRAEALREHVAHAAELEHGAHAAARDDAGSFRCGAQHDPRRIELPERLVRDRRAVLGDREHVLLRVLDGLRDGERNLARLAVTDADAIDLVADDDERREREPPAALDDLGDAVDLDHALLELACICVIDTHQNVRPPSRAPSASDLTRPWYR